MKKLASIVIPFLLVAGSRAEDVERAAQVRAKAIDQYNRAIMANPGSPALEKDALRQRTLAPALKRYQDAAVVEQKRPLFPLPPPARKLSTAEKAAMRAEKKKKKSARKAARLAKNTGLKPPAGGGVQKSPSSARPETVIDGSGIPKVIEFSGRPKKKQ